VNLSYSCGDEIFVKNISDLWIEVEGNTCEYSYIIYGERKDINDLNVDVEI
jgi:phenylacetate-coenzyme A ligase PaaK-like adenylate-forming protein